MCFFQELEWFCFCTFLLLALLFRFLSGSDSPNNRDSHHSLNFRTHLFYFGKHYYISKVIIQRKVLPFCIALNLFLLTLSYKFLGHCWSYPQKEHLIFDRFWFFQNHCHWSWPYSNNCSPNFSECWLTKLYCFLLVSMISQLCHNRNHHR